MDKFISRYGRLIVREMLILAVSLFISFISYISAFIIFTRFAAFFDPRQNLEYILATIFLIIIWNYPILIAIRIVLFYLKRKNMVK